MAPFTPITVSALSPLGYLVTATTDRYALEWTTGAGRPVRIERSHQPVRVQAQEHAQYRARAEAFARMLDYSVNVPREKPPFWAFQVDDEGRLWIARHQPGVFAPETPEEARVRGMVISPAGLGPLEWREPLVIDVIEPGGRFLGTLTFPANNVTLGTARGNDVWVIEHGRFGEQYVVRYRIEPGGH